jgi:hypothetical protein
VPLEAVKVLRFKHFGLLRNRIFGLYPANI